MGEKGQGGQAKVGDVGGSGDEQAQASQQSFRADRGLARSGRRWTASQLGVSGYTEGDRSA